MQVKKKFYNYVKTSTHLKVFTGWGQPKKSYKWQQGNDFPVARDCWPEGMPSTPLASRPLPESEQPPFQKERRSQETPAHQGRKRGKHSD